MIKLADINKIYNEGRSSEFQALYSLFLTIQGNGGNSGASVGVSCSNTQVNAATAKREYIASLRKTSVLHLLWIHT